MTTDQTVPLDLLDRTSLRRRARNVGIAALFVGAAFGGIVGLFAGPAGFAVTLLAIAVPLVLLAYSESRKTVWLDGTKLCVRSLGTRTVDLHTAAERDVLVTDARGVRTVSLFVRGGTGRSRAISVGLAMYAGTGGRELGVFGLRRLADSLAGSGDAHALVLSELVVAQLRSEARGDGAADRPLYRLATLVPQGRMAQKLRPDAVAKFVTALD